MNVPYLSARSAWPRGPLVFCAASAPSCLCGSATYLTWVPSSKRGKKKGQQKSRQTTRRPIANVSTTGRALSLLHLFAVARSHDPPVPRARTPDGLGKLFLLGVTESRDRDPAPFACSYSFLSRLFPERRWNASPSPPQQQRRSAIERPATHKTKKQAPTRLYAPTPRSDKSTFAASLLTIASHRARDTRAYSNKQLAHGQRSALASQSVHPSIHPSIPSAPKVQTWTAPPKSRLILRHDWCSVSPYFEV